MLRASCFWAVISVLGTVCVGSLGAQVSQPPPTPLLPAEEFILTRISAGDSADLDKSNLAQDHKVRGVFLAKLLVGEYQGTSGWRDLIIRHADVTGEFKLRSADIHREIILADCEFQGRVNLSFSHFSKSLSFLRSIFHQAAMFSGMKVSEMLNLQETTFFEEADFGTVEVGGQLLAPEATFKKNVRMSLLNVGGYTDFTGAVFEGPADFNGIEIKGSFEADGTEFRAESNFNGATVRDTVFFSCHRTPAGCDKYATFRDEATFAGMAVSGQMQADGVIFAGRGKKVDFNGFHCLQTAFLKHSRFAGSADFTTAVFGKDLHLDGASFACRSCLVRLNAVQVKQQADLSEVAVEGPLDLNGAEINGFLSLNSSRFRSDVLLEVSVGQTLDISHTVFDGSVDLVQSVVARDFNAKGAIFSSHKAVSLQRMQVGGNVDLASTSFTGSADLRHLEAKLDFIADRASFLGDANFDFLHVGSLTSFEDAQFGKSTRFEGAHLSGDLNVVRTTFRQKANFDRVRIDGDMRLIVGTKLEDISLEDAELGNVAIHGSHTGSPVSLISLSRSTLQSSLTVEEVDIGVINLVQTRVAGPTKFEAVRVRERLNLQGAKFSTLELQGVMLPPSGARDGGDTGRVLLNQLQYAQLVAEGKEGELDSPLKLVELADYSSESYFELEEFYKSQGDTTNADAVYSAMKRREARRRGFVSRGVSFILDHLIMYGRRPMRTLFISACIIVLGWCVFASRRYVQPSKPEYSDECYHSFWYSLDLFLPGVSLGVAERWVPATSSPWRWYYAQLHRVSGWVLVPIWLLAITGLFK